MLSRRRTTKVNKRHCALTFNNHGLAVACGHMNSAETLTIDACAEFVDVQAGQWAKTLIPWVQAQRLKHATCTWVLNDTQYQLIQLDAFNVPADELRQAVAWQIKERIDYPLQEAVFDVFPSRLPMPGKSQASLFVAVTRQSYLESVIAELKKCNLHLAVVDIRELVLRNIASLYEMSQHGLAIVQLDEYATHLVISSEQEFCFSRRLGYTLDWGVLAADEKRMDNALQALALEIQRCLDYYTSQLRQPAPRQIVLAPVASLSTSQVQRLQTLLAIDTQILDLSSYAWAQTISPELQCQSILALGALMRYKVEPHAAAS